MAIWCKESANVKVRPVGSPRRLLRKVVFTFP